MKFLLAVIIAVFAVVPSAFCLSSSDMEARGVALRWLALVDKGDYGRAFHEEVPRIQQGGTFENFQRFMRGRRAPLGNPITREFYRVVARKQMLGAPDGDYQTIIFKTRYTHKFRGAEALTLSHETGRWQVSGYNFY